MMDMTVNLEGIAVELDRLHLLAKLLGNLNEDVALDAEELGVLGDLTDECSNSVEGFIPRHRSDLELRLVKKAE